MAEFQRGSVQAHNLLFHYLEMGDGPLALCLHGFPDSPFTYRYLLPELATAGYRAVTPFIRGFAPTEVPPERRHVHTSTMVADTVGLHEALEGDGNAVLIAHGWGAVAAWGGAVRHPVLYLHGTNDGCYGLNAQQVASVPSYLGEGSRSELIEGVGHFMMVERPAEINEKIVEFVRR